MQSDVDVVHAVYDAFGRADLPAILALFRSRVVQVGRTRGRVRATGAGFDVFESHVWTLEDQQVRRFEVYLDTAAMLAALSAPAAADLVPPAGRSTPPADVRPPPARRPVAGS